MVSCGVVATSHYCSKEDLKRIEKNIKRIGFDKTNFYISKNLFFDKWAGTPTERLNLFYQSWSSKSPIIFAAKAGSGIIQIVKKIDFSKLKKNKKLFVGYSNLTLLLNLIYQEVEIIALHGPTGFQNINERSLSALKDAIQMKNYGVNFSKKQIINCVEDKIEGVIMGGNLRNLYKGLALGLNLDFRNKIVFIEDKEIDNKEIKEFKIFNILISLKQNKYFRPKAILIGGLGKGKNEKFKEMMKYLFPNTPMVNGLPFGHELTNITVPIGAKCNIDFEKGKISFLFPKSEKDYAVNLN